MEPVHSATVAMAPPMRIARLAPYRSASRPVELDSRRTINTGRLVANDVIALSLDEAMDKILTSELIEVSTPNETRCAAKEPMVGVGAGIFMTTLHYGIGSGWPGSALTKTLSTCEIRFMMSIRL